MKFFGGQHLSNPFPPLTGGYGMFVCVCSGALSDILGNVGSSGSIGSVSIGSKTGSVGVSGLKVTAANVLNCSVVCHLSSVGVIPKLDRSIGTIICGGEYMLVLRVLVITGDLLVGVPSGVGRLLNGDVASWVPVIR